MIRDLFGFDGKTALVVGGASGMGAAAANMLHELGAFVVIMDFAKPDVDFTPDQVIELDLRAKQSIDAAIDVCPKKVDVLLSCAGVADGTEGIDRVNFIGQRHLIETLVQRGTLARGSAIAMISSVAGLGWERELSLMTEFLETPSYEAAVSWIEAHPDRASYYWTKKAVCAYVARQAFDFFKRGIRINAIEPGPTDTPLARKNADTWLRAGKEYRDAVNVDAASPQDQAGPLVFLCSNAAGRVNGISFVVDGGYVSAGVTGMFDAPGIKKLVGIE